MKLTILFFALLFGQTVYSQNSVKWGFSSGVGIFKTGVSNIQGAEFKEKTVYSLAPTGFSLSMDINKKWEAEFRYGLMSLYNDSYHFKNSTSESFAQSGAQTANAFSARYKRKIKLNKTISIAPFAGLTYISLDNNLGNEEWGIRSSSTSIKGTDTIHVFVYDKRTALNHFTLGVDLGAEISVHLFKGVYSSTNVNFYYNPEVYAMQEIRWEEDKQPKSSAVISYGYQGFFIQTGIKWHWRDFAEKK